MRDADCTAFLQWALPTLERRWVGYRKVRSLVCKRLGRRLRALQLRDLQAYQLYLQGHEQEWPELDALLGIPISRFYRDCGVFAFLESEVLPALARAALGEARTALDCWSAGCASGEEPYTLEILWKLRLKPAYPQLGCRVVATDNDASLLERAKAGCYRPSSLKELPPGLCAQAFEPHGGALCVRAQFRDIEFTPQDMRSTMPEGPFDLVLCRNNVLTYYLEPVQRSVMQRVASRMRAGSALVVGVHEALPQDVTGFACWTGGRGVFRRIAGAANV